MCLSLRTVCGQLSPDETTIFAVHLWRHGCLEIFEFLCSFLFFLMSVFQIQLITKYTNMLLEYTITAVSVCVTPI